MSIKISIVIPVFNGQRYIIQALESVLAQTRTPFEIIVHDDNSSDDTIKLISEYANCIKVFRNEHGPSGFVNGWNRAISLATGDYIVILHQDDILYPTYLEECEKALKAHPDVLHLFTPCDYIDQDGEVLHEFPIQNGEVKRYSRDEYILAYQRKYGDMPHIHRCPGVMTHRSVFEQGCKYREEAGHIADDDFFYRVGSYTDVIGILKPLAAYRHHTGSETSSIGDLKLVARLARDYIFQLSEWKSNSEHLHFFTTHASKYLYRLGGYAVLHKDPTAIELYQQYFRELRSKNMGKVFWFFNLKLEAIYLYLKILGFVNQYKRGTGI